MTIYTSLAGSDFRREPDGADIEQLEAEGRTVFVVRGINNQRPALNHVGNLTEGAN